MLCRLEQPAQRQPLISKSRFKPNSGLIPALAGILLILVATAAGGHGVDQATADFLTRQNGTAIVPFMYIGAKHMFTGYDHLLFLTAVIFFLFRIRDILIYVSLFTLGHSLTLLSAVLTHTAFNAYLIDAIIGLSVVYKGFDNLGGFRSWLGKQPNTKIAVFVFGLFHGFGLATRLLDYHLPRDGLLANLLAFNAGVELGQALALYYILLIIRYWRTKPSFYRFSTAVNTLLMSSGFILCGYQLSGFFTV